VRHYGSASTRSKRASSPWGTRVKTVQIIFNLFRQRPAEAFLREAMLRGVGIVVRVPLARAAHREDDRDTTFPKSDHRAFNRTGSSSTRARPFGIDFETGLELVEELRPLVPAGATMAQFALRWILMHEAVSTVIPGPRPPTRHARNAAAPSWGPCRPRSWRRPRPLRAPGEALVHHLCRRPAGPPRSAPDGPGR